jgi:hypothetical protein
MVDYQSRFRHFIIRYYKSESPSLTYEVQQFVSGSVKDYEGETKYKQFQKVKANEYFNGLQVKFSYAITCHKSQGGQWNTVL